MKKVSVVVILSVFLLSSCVMTHVPPGQAKKIANPPPGQVKKATGSKSAAPYAPGKKKGN